MSHSMRLANLLNIFIVLFLFSGNAAAENTNLHAKSRSYQVYLGVTPGSRITKDPYLVDRDVNLHGGIDTLSENDYHVMVAIFDNDKNQRIKDATVIAKVEKKGIMADDETLLPLEKMITSGTVTYGNFFRLSKDETYNIEVSIYRPKRSGYEEVEFKYKPF